MAPLPPTPEDSPGPAICHERTPKRCRLTRSRKNRGLFSLPGGGEDAGDVGPLKDDPGDKTKRTVSVFADEWPVKGEQTPRRLIVDQYQRAPGLGQVVAAPPVCDLPKYQQYLVGPGPLADKLRRPQGGPDPTGAAGRRLVHRLGQNPKVIGGRVTVEFQCTLTPRTGMSKDLETGQHARSRLAAPLRIAGSHPLTTRPGRPPTGLILK